MKWDTDSFIELYFVQMNIYFYKNILSEPLVNYAILFVFFNLFFFSNRERIEISNLFFKKNCDSQFIQNRAALVYMLLLLHISH